MSGTRTSEHEWSPGPVGVRPENRRVDMTSRDEPRTKSVLGLSSVRRNDLVAVLLGVVAIGLYASRLGFDYYLSSDAAHYLADADAISGHGVRESRHLPVFPSLLSLVRLGFGDLEALRVTMLIVVAIAFVGFYGATRRSFGPSVAAPIAAFTFVVNPLMAEAVGWYGGSMSLGFALIVPAMAATNVALRDRRPRIAVVAGLLCGATALSHPFACFVLAIMCVAITLARWSKSTLRRVAPMALIIGAIALVAWLPWRSFYVELVAPSGEAPGLHVGHLGLLWSWAFRDMPLVWATVTILGLIVGWRTISFRPPNMGGILIGASALALAITIVLSGSTSYITRPLYLVTMGVAFAVGCLVRSAARVRWPIPTAAAVSVLVVLLAVAASTATSHRLDAALPYYNGVTKNEMAALQRLRRDPGGTVVVTPRGPDKNAGTLYAWRVEGISRHRAIGPGQPFLYLLERAHVDSLDAERMLAGSVILEADGIRIGAETATSSLSVSAVVDGDWIPLWQIQVLPRPGLDLEWHPRVSKSDRKIFVDAADGSASQPFSIEVRRSKGRASVLLHWNSASVSVHLAPPPSGPATVTHSEPVTVEPATGDSGLSTSLIPGATVALRQIPTASRAASFTATGGPQPSALELEISGVDRVTSPAAMFTASSLLRKQGVRYLFTWRGSDAYPILSQRRCMTPSFSSGSVVVLRVSCIPKERA